MESNPYAPPQVAELSAPAGQMELIRHEHIRVERTAKSLGILYYLGAFFLLMFGVTGLVTTVAPDQPRPGGTLFVSVIVLVLGVGHGFLAYGLRRLRGWARWPAVVLSAIGLLGFPIGTIISAYILVNLLGTKANMVFSPYYQDVIAATPHVKMKTSMGVKVVLAILLLILVALVVNVMMMD